MFKYMLLILGIVFLPTCGMLSHYNLVQCAETQELTFETMKTFSSLDLCEKVARELNIDTSSYLYYCEERSAFQK